MRAAIRSEFRKAFSTRIWWILLLCMAAYVAFISGLMGAAVASGPSGSASFGDGAAMPKTIYSLGNDYGYPFAVAFGALTVTAEYRHRTMTPTLLTLPNRTLMLATKLLCAGGVGLLFGVVASAAALTAAPFMHFAGDGAYLTDPSVWAVLAGNVVAIALWTVIGAAFGAVVTNQVVAIVAVIAFSQLLEPLARVAMASWSATQEIGKFLPGSAASAVSGTSLYSVIGGGVELLSRWQGALVMLAYVVVFAVIARLWTLRRDVH